MDGSEGEAYITFMPCISHGQILINASCLEEPFGPNPQVFLYCRGARTHAIKRQKN